MAATEPAQRDPQPTDPDSGSGSGSSSGPASGPGSILWPALRVGTISGIGGVAFGSVTGLIRSSSPTLFGLFSGAQCFSLGATFWGFRGFIFRYRYRSQPDPPLREKVLMSSMAGGLAGGSLGFILRGRANVVPGAIMFSIFGAGTQGLISYLSRGPSPESVNKAPLLQRIARSKWSPMKILSDEEYLAMLEQKLSRVDAEVAVMDEKIRALRQESEEYHRNAAIRDESNKN